MRMIYQCYDCRLIAECGEGDKLPPPGWKQIEQVDGCKSWFCGSCSKRPEPEEPERKTYINDMKTLEFKNLGELLTACHKYLKKNKTDVKDILDKYDLTVPAQLKLAWIDILEAA